MRLVFIEKKERKKMKNQKNRILAITVAILLASSAFAILPLTNAKNTNAIIPTWAFLSAVPNPVGIGQTLFLDMWIDKVPATAAGYYGDRWQNFTIAVTLPDKTTTTLGPYTSDAAGGAAAAYAPTEQGNYTFIFSFPGQTLTGGPGYPADAAQLYVPAAVGDVYGGSTSAPLTVTVSSTPASTIPQNPLPTGYWQDPVEGFNTNWYVLNQNWLGMAAINFGNTGGYAYQGGVNPYSQAVLTPHIVWTKPESAGGQMGGIFGGNESSDFYTGMQYEPKFAPIVLNGVLYYTNFPGANTDPSGWTALNLRTGQVLWTKNTTEDLLCGQVVDPATLDEYGGFSYLWATRVTALEARNTPVTVWDMFDAQTGNYILSISGIVSGTKILGTDGSILMYYVNGTTTKSLTLWNSTQCLISGMPYFRTGAIVTAGLWMPPQGATLSFQAGVEWSVPLPATYQGNPITLAIGYIDQPDQKMVLTFNNSPNIGRTGAQAGWQVEAGYTMGGSMDTTGRATQLWITNRTETGYATIYMGPAGDGVFCEFTDETMTWQGFNINTGAKVWGPTTAYSNPLGYYEAGSPTAEVSGTNMIAWTFGGQIYDFNITNGNEIWVYSNPSTGENNPYGVNPFWQFSPHEATIAGGVIYLVTGHNYGPPLFNGAEIYAINVTTGKEIWQFLNFATMSSLPVVDGELLSYNSYDNQIYAYGKGNTATTVSASPGQNSNKDVLIQGYVTDQSPGQTCLGIPEAGTPAIADVYMSQWMEYLFEQSPKPTNATGVQVTLTYLDPNNNTGTIGTTYSNINGQYAYKFAPPVPGIYTIIATFGGSNSYYSSTAQTSYLFESPPSETAVPTATPTSVADLYFVPAIVGLFVLIIIVLAVVIVLMLRKRS